MNEVNHTSETEDTWAGDSWQIQSKMSFAIRHQTPSTAVLTVHPVTSQWESTAAAKLAAQLSSQWMNVISKHFRSVIQMALDFIFLKKFFFLG